MTGLATPHVPVSWGELLDKITILEIKREKILEPKAQENILRELSQLLKIAGTATADAEVASAMDDLRRINLALWDVEEELRFKEALADFGQEFVGLARSVYKTNDERAAVKRRINARLASELVEEKSYSTNRVLQEAGSSRLASP